MEVNFHFHLDKETLRIEEHQSLSDLQQSGFANESYHVRILDFTGEKK
jgi:hypothetical protein